MTTRDMTKEQILAHRARLSATTGVAFGASTELVPSSGPLRIQFSSADEAEAARVLGRPLTDRELALAREEGADLVTFARLKQKADEQASLKG